jgi:hypothetical protein
MIAPSPHLRRPASIVLFFALISLPLPAAVIDLFADGPQEVASPGSLRAVPQMLTFGVFEQRDLAINYNYIAQQGTILDGSLRYSVSPIPTSLTGPNRGYLNVRYSSSQPVDLLGDGSTAFQIQFDHFDATYPYLLDFYIRDADSFYPSYYSMRGLLMDASPAGTITIPFSAFSLTDLSRIRDLGIDASRMPMGSSFTISSITTVPEPTFPALAGSMGVAWLGRRRRNRQSI